MRFIAPGKSRKAGALTRTLVLVVALSTPTAKSAVAATEAEALVEKARFTIEKLLSDPDFSELPGYVARARGILILPQLVKGGFVVGGEGGSGVLLVKGSDGSWSPPAFFTLAAGSIGLQIGGQVSESVFTLMNDGAVNAMLDHRVKLGGDVSIAVGPIGKGLEASTTTNLYKDVYAFTKAVGLFGGGSIEGAAIFKRDELNGEYYAAGATPRSILLERKYFNPHADPLRQALAK